MSGKPNLAVFRTIGVVAAVAAVTFCDFSLRVNSATAGFTFLVLILGLATQVGLQESITASLISVAAYNFYFLPPVGAFTIADPQNWIALLAFLVTAITASQLSSSARKKTEEARARQEELQRMYDFSRGLILGKEEFSLADQVVRQIAESFGVETAWFYDAATDKISKIEGTRPIFEKARLVEIAATGQTWSNAADNAFVLPVRLGGVKIGSLAVAGGLVLSEIALQAIAQLVAIAIQRARAQEIANQLQATQQNEQLKSTLLDALAHEFKTPLTSVKAAATTLLNAQSLSDSEERDLLSVVDEEADRLTKLVSDSIELARMGSAPLLISNEEHSAEKLIYSTLDDLRVLFDGRTLKVEIDDDLPSVLVDGHLSELALRQVLTNALKYSPTDSEIRVTAVRKGGFVVVNVVDQGLGIPKSDLGKIFDKFYRGPEVRNRVPGTGMGLNITREIIHAQGGDVSVQSEPGRGTTFSITFPIFDFLRRV